LINFRGQKRPGPPPGLPDLIYLFAGRMKKISLREISPRAPARRSAIRWGRAVAAAPGSLLYPSTVWP